MLPLTRLLVAAAVIAGAFAWSTPSAGACTCDSVTDQAAFETADVVFEAELVDYSYDEDPDGDGLISSTDPAVWTFAVAGVYKGEVRQTEDVYSAVSGASCGLEIQPTGTFYVFADWITADGAAAGYPIGDLTAGLCGGTRSIVDGPLQLQLEVEPVAPIADAPTATTTPLRPSTGVAEVSEPLTGGGVLVVGFIAVGIVGAFVAARLAKRSREI